MLTLSSSFKNGDVIFSWDNPQKTYKYYFVIINNQRDWTSIFEPIYTVKNALVYDFISINVRAEHSSKDNKLIYNGELHARCLHHYISRLIKLMYDTLFSVPFGNLLSFYKRLNVSVPSIS